MSKLPQQRGYAVEVLLALRMGQEVLPALSHIVAVTPRLDPGLDVVTQQVQSLHGLGPRPLESGAIPGGDPDGREHNPKGVVPNDRGLQNVIPVARSMVQKHKGSPGCLRVCAVRA